MNYYVHLTNHAVQCNSKNYGTLLKGNIFGLTEFEQYIKDKEKDNKDCSIPFGTGYFIQKIKESIGLTFDSAQDILNPKGRAGTFELFGFDFMIDERYHCWMLECNTNPSLDESNEFLSQLLCRMTGRKFLTKTRCSS